MALEQRVVDRLYHCLDTARTSAAQQLHATLRGDGTGTPQARSERDALTAATSARLRALHAVEEGLVFGRLDLTSGRCYIGKIGLRDDSRHSLLVDWRAPAAEAFYQATPADARGVLRRRHLKVRDRLVVGLHDDLIAETAGDAAIQPVAFDSGDTALIEALTQPRTDRMRDMVTTIQAEQDQIIRAPLSGVHVVQGGPGTGKTAVALHRIAYLLHKHRDQLERRGVLLLGPSTTFLRYVADVLPGLGETGVAATTVTDLYPAASVTCADPSAVAALKGSLRMLPVLRAAVAAQPRPLRADRILDVDGTVLRLRAEVVTAAQSAASATGDPHNLAREEFCLRVMHDLSRQLTDVDPPEHPGPDGTDAVLQRLHRNPDVRREVNLCWMPRRPETILSQLWGDPLFLRQCAPDLTDRERAMLRREGDGWSEADIPILDELAEMLGPMPPTVNQLKDQARGRAELRERVAFAADSLSILGLGSMIDAELLAGRFAEGEPSRTLAEGALADREWAYGHVAVDEAQELSPMAWRMVFRRCPTRSMTVVGDVNQASSPACVQDWADVFDTHAPGRWRLYQLTVNYRTPGLLMDLAAAHLNAFGRLHPPMRSLRVGRSPSHHRAVDGDLIPRARQIAEELSASQPGTVAILLSGSDIPRPWTSQDRDLAACPAPADAAILPVREAKGLEFDHVVLVEPAAFLDADHPNGVNDLYVALTRATQTLTLVHQRDLPEALTAPPDAGVNARDL